MLSKLMLHAIYILQVNSNGVLSFEMAFLDYRSSEFPIDSSPLITPFWSDFNPRYGGNITYRQSNDSSLLRSVHSLLLEVDVGNLSGFYPEHVFIATWDRVPPYAGGLAQITLLRVQLYLYTYSCSVHYAVRNFNTIAKHTASSTGNRWCTDYCCLHL